MASRYNFSKQRINKITGEAETYQVIEANSFDEARTEVDKGIHWQELEEQKFFKAKEILRGGTSPLSRTLNGPGSISAIDPLKQPVQG